MANVFPFEAYRYTAKAGALQNLVTQPYDKISPEMRQRYLQSSPYNLVRIILRRERLPLRIPKATMSTRGQPDTLMTGLRKASSRPMPSRLCSLISRNSPCPTAASASCEKVLSG